MIIVSAGDFLVVQWLGLLASTLEGMGTVSGWGTKIPQTMQHGQKKKKYLPKSLEYVSKQVHFLRISGCDLSLFKVVAVSSLSEPVGSKSATCNSEH